MKMQALKSAAHAAGYAMATEDMPEPRVVDVRKNPPARSTALTVSVPRRARSKILAAQILMRRLGLRDWFAAHWSGRATA